MPIDRAAQARGLGQSLWYDNISRGLIASGAIKKLVDDGVITGITTNPTIFQKAIEAGAEYDDAIRTLVSQGKDVGAIYASLWAPEAALIAKQLPDLGLDVRMIGPDGQFEPKDYIEASGGAAEGNYVTFLAPDMRKVPAAARFVKAFEAKYGALSSYGPLAYEAANIILEAAKKAGVKFYFIEDESPSSEQQIPQSLRYLEQVKW